MYYLDCNSGDYGLIPYYSTTLYGVPVPMPTILELYIMYMVIYIYIVQRVSTETHIDNATYHKSAAT